MELEVTGTLTSAAASHPTVSEQTGFRSSATLASAARKIDDPGPAAAQARNRKQLDYSNLEQSHCEILQSEVGRQIQSALFAVLLYILWFVVRAMQQIKSKHPVHSLPVKQCAQCA